MPHIEEEDYNLLLAQQDENERLENEIEKDREGKRKYKIISLILACLLFLGLAFLAFYFFKYAKNFVKIEDSQQVIETETIQDYELKISDLQQIVDASNIKESLQDQIIYAVQIGAFKEKDISLFSPNLINFKEISDAGYNKYALGNFQNLEEAQSFRRELLTLGFRDAFIASYRNNERLKIEEPE